MGSVGFCMGGALSLVEFGQDSAVAFYGLPQPGLSQPENIKFPVQLHFGRLDEYKGFSDAESATVFAEKIKGAGGTPELFIYEECGHGFLNEGEEGIAKREHMGFPHPPPADQQLAWERVLGFFDKTLKH